MKVIHTIASLRSDHGGPSRTVCALASALTEREVDSVIVTSRRPAEPEPIQPTSARVAVRARERHGGSRRSLARLLAEELHADAPLIVHDHGLWLPTNHESARAARRAGVPRVVSPRGMLSSWALGYRRAKKRLAWWSFQRHDLASAAVVHATSGEEAEEIRRVGVRQPIAIVPNGVEMPPPPAFDHGSAARPGCRRALFLSRVHPKKGLPNLLAAWAQVRPAGWDLVIAGPDENGHQRELEEFLRGAQLEASVRFVGTVPDADKWALYRSADLFVLPTHSENFGLVVAEALAAEVPVLTTTAAPWQELESARCGWWVDPTAAAVRAALAEAVALSDSERRQMGARGRRLVESRYSWSRAAEQFAAVYTWIHGHGVVPDCLVLE